MKLLLLLLLQPAADVQVPNRVDEHQAVRVDVTTDSQFASCTVLARHAFDAVQVFELRTAAGRAWVFCGPPDTYLVTVTLYDPQAGIQSVVRRVTIGGQPDPPGPGPAPDPEPDDLPNDEFGNVAQFARNAGRGLPGVVQVAEQYAAAAAGLLDGTHATARDGIMAVDLPDGWDEFAVGINKRIADAWPMSKPEAARFLSLVERGLR